jgi:hypothetical protein
MSFDELEKSYEKSVLEPFWTSEEDFDATRELLEAFSIYPDDLTADLGEYTPRTVDDVTLSFGEDTFYALYKLKLQDRENLRKFAVLSIGRSWLECSCDSTFPEDSAEFLGEIFLKVFESKGYLRQDLGCILQQMAFNEALLNLTSKLLNYFLQLNGRPLTSARKLRSLINKLRIPRGTFVDFHPSSDAFSAFLTHLMNLDLRVDSETLQPHVTSFLSELSPKCRIDEWEGFLCNFNDGGYYAQNLISHPCKVSVACESEAHTTILRLLTLIKLLDYQSLKISFADVVLAESIAILQRRSIEHARTEALMRPLRREMRRAAR